MFFLGVIGVLASITAAAGAGWWVGSRAMRERRRELYAPRAVPSEPLKSSIIAAVRDVPEPPDAQREDQIVLENALRMAADQHGADVASLWAVQEGDEANPEPIAWSSGDAPPELSERAMGLIAWSGETDLISIDRSDERPEAFIAVAPVREGPFRGALALSFTAAYGSISSRPVLKAWLPRHARRLGTLFEVLRTRGEVARVNFRLRHAIRASADLQRERDPMRLVIMLAEEAAHVVGCEWSMLVRWYPGEKSGDVRASTREFVGDDGTVIVRKGAVSPDDEGTKVSVGTVVGDVCRDGVMIVLGDARRFEGQLLTDKLKVPRSGSMLVVPVKMGLEREDPVLGALICWHSWPGALTESDGRQLREVAMIGAGALASAWDMEIQREAARTDALTGLPNRRHFDEKFAETVTWIDRLDAGSMALVIADIDLFKAVNDTYGHEAGDEVLKGIARVLRAERRSTDFVARLGGEELAVILPNVGADDARAIAESLRQRVEELRVRAGVELIGVTASFGVAVYNSGAGDWGTIFERADKALYVAKKSGRNRVELAPPGMAVGSARRRR